LRTLAVRAQQKGLELACHIAPEVPDALVGDAGRLRQVVINLVGNAIKFADRGEVLVDVRLEGRAGEQVWLHGTVTDTGIGIPAGMLGNSGMRRAAAAAQPYALVVLDAMMPEMDGFALAEQIRGHPEFAEATIMMLSSADRAGDAARCETLGIAAHLMKPVKQ